MLLNGQTDAQLYGIYVGDTRISEVYLGDQRIFPDYQEPFEVGEYVEEIDPEAPEPMDEPTVSEQIRFVSDKQKEAPEGEIPQYSLSPEAQEVLENLVREMVAEDPSLDLIEEEDEEEEEDEVSQAPQ